MTHPKRLIRVNVPNRAYVTLVVCGSGKVEVKIYVHIAIRVTFCKALNNEHIRVLLDMYEPHNISVDVVSDFTIVPPYVAISHTWNHDLELFTRYEGIQPYDVQINASLHQGRHVARGIIKIAKLVIDLGKFRANNAINKDEPKWTSAPMYFWIDAVCINQQDTDDIFADLPYMNDIYRNSKAVICLLQPLSEFDLFGADTGDFKKELRWFYRVWTYQEQHLKGSNSDIWFADTRDRLRKRVKGYISDKGVEYWKKIKFQFLYFRSGKLLIPHYHTFFDMVLPHIEGNQMEEMKFIRNSTEDQESLARLMSITRYRGSKHEEDMVIGVLGALNKRIYIPKDAYGKGEYYVLNKVIKQLSPQVSAQFVSYSYYPQKHQTQTIERMLTGNRETYISTHDMCCTSEHIRILSIMPDRILCEAEIVSGCIYSMDTSDDDEYKECKICIDFTSITSLPVYEEWGRGGIIGFVSNEIKCMDFVHLVLISKLRRPVVDHYVYRQLKGYKEQGDFDIDMWAICCTGYNKRGIVFSTTGSLRGSRKSIHIS
jgi:hypothetical protein